MTVKPKCISRVTGLGALVLSCCCKSFPLFCPCSPEGSSALLNILPFSRPLPLINTKFSLISDHKSPGYPSVAR